MSLSSFEEKFDERNNYFLSSEEEKKKKKKVPRMMMESQQRKIRKNSRLAFSTKKKVHCLHITLTRKNNKERARGCVCVRV